jgi:hypothetical protein
VKTWILMLSLLVLAGGLSALETPPDDAKHRRALTQLSSVVRISPTSAKGTGHLKASPQFASVFQPRLLQYANAADVPDFTTNFNGNGVPVANSTLPRNKYAIGIQTNGMDGGGCVAIDITNPFGGCVQITNASGNLVTAQIAREIWTFRFSYLDPSTPSSSEVNITSGGDYVLEYVQMTPGGHRCFTFYPCDFYGINLDYLTGTVTLSNPTCAMKLGPGYHAYVFYQASPYNEGAVPAGAQEWYPPKVSATPTRLEQPGGILLSRAYSLGRADNALSISGGGLVHPSVDATGYTGVHDPLNLGISSIPPGSETIHVASYDCGAIQNVAFSISREFIESGGHGAHSATSGPPLDSVSSLDANSGTTDSNGNWTTTLHAGSVAETIKYTATASNLLGSPFTSPPLLVATGFLGLADPGPNDPNIRYTGNTSVVGLRHPSNHNGSAELHEFVRNLAAQYNLRKAQPALQGSLGLNDTSLVMGGVFDINANWLTPHSQHSFGVACDIDHQAMRFTDGAMINVDYWGTLLITATDLGGFLLIETTNQNNLHVQIPESQISDVLLRETR